MQQVGDILKVLFKLTQVLVLISIKFVIDFNKM